jgi:hypothetical protein
MMIVNCYIKNKKQPIELSKAFSIWGKTWAALFSTAKVRENPELL